MNNFNIFDDNSKRARCVMCGGSGKCDYIGEESCNGCAGTGRDLRSDLWSEPCLKCNGRRKVTYCRKETCRSCNGNGYIRY